MNLYGFKNQREVARAFDFTGRIIREPVPAKMKKEILKRAKNKCKICRKIKNTEIKLEFHHKKMKSDHNKISNILALCPNCHAKEHQKYKREVIKNPIMGIHEGVKVTKRKTKKKTPKRKSISPQDFFNFKI